MEEGKKAFSPLMCKIKHENVDKNIDEIKEDIEDIRETQDNQHEEIKQMITDLSQKVIDSHTNLKNKIILSEKTTGDKIDSLNDFDETLKGNGDPGIWEYVRNIRKNIKIIMWSIVVIIILVLGGDYEGVSIENIKKKLGLKKQETKQVQPAPTPIIKTP